MDVVDKAVQLFNNGSACSQAVFAAFAPALGMDERLAHQLSTGFGAGMGKKQLVCGAITGGILVLNAKYGNLDASGGEEKKRTYTEVNQLITEMENKLGHSGCLEILGMDITKDENMKLAQEKGLFDTICANCVKEVASYLDQHLSKE